MSVIGKTTNPLKANPLQGQSFAATEGDMEAIRGLGEARKRLKQEIAKVIIGQESIVDDLLTALFARGPLPHDRRAGPGQDAHGPHHRAGDRPGLQSRPVHARPDALGHHRHRDHRGGPRGRRPSLPFRPGARSSPTSCSPTRSTAPRPRRRPRCSRRCRSSRSRPAARRMTCPAPSSSWRRRTRSSRRGRIPCPRPSSTASCSTSASATRSPRKSCKSPSRPPPTTPPTWRRC